MKAATVLRELDEKGYAAEIQGDGRISVTPEPSIGLRHDLAEVGAELVELLWDLPTAAVLIEALERSGFGLGDGEFDLTWKGEDRLPRPEEMGTERLEAIVRLLWAHKDAIDVVLRRRASAAVEPHVVQPEPKE